VLLMPGILPEIETANAVVYRDAAGNPTNPANVHNAYPPLPPFLSSCLLTALPSGCDARIDVKQINAIVSELLSFAECLNPNGTWDCNSLKNLCAAFTAWANINLQFIHVGDMPPAPRPNQLWWESDTGIFWLWYADGTSTQWVQINGATVGSGAGGGGGEPLPPIVMDGISIVGVGTASEPYAVGTVDGGNY